ncbi:MAG TPA: transposase [Candidatus Paceibacterota bacterium]|nr:transposase [Candidatus Paceibacterota bacterium]
MRVEPYGVGSIVHITNRGVRGTDIVRDTADKRNFMRSLFYLNDTYTSRNWRREIADIGMFERPSVWPERDPLARILAWTLLDNHFHLLAQEIREGGVAKFMQRLCGSLAMSFNLKYREKGSIFQSSYHARSVTEDKHHQYLVFYVLVKNVLDLYPGGLTAAALNFDDAWEWAKQYPYSSFRDSIAGKESPVLADPDMLIASILGTGDVYKQEAKDMLDFHLASRGEAFKDIMLEPW